MAIKIGQDISGDNPAHFLEMLEKQAPEMFDKALHQDALELEADSVDLVPVDEAVLQRSSRVEKTSEGYTVGYYTDYAVYVHEMPGGYNFTKPGTGPKFLQRPFEKRMKDFAERMAKRMKDALGV